ncbi:phospholipase carboxylesterase [Botrytis cinerea]
MALVHFDVLLPYTKLIFPSGTLRKTTVFGGNLTNAWFDIADFSDRTIGEEEQKEGLRESVEYLGELIENVVDNESHDEDGKVFVGGLSQGCAMSVILLLSGELDRLEVLHKIGGFVGFSGWLPFAKQIAEVAAAGKDWRQKRILVRNWLRCELGLPSLQPRDDMLVATEGDMKIFLAHGTNDTKSWRKLKKLAIAEWVEEKNKKSENKHISPQGFKFMSYFVREATHRG